MESMRRWDLLGKLLSLNRHPLPSAVLIRITVKLQQMPHSYKAGNKSIFVIQPIFEHNPSVKSPVYYQHPAVARKLEYLMNSFKHNRILSWITGLFMAERLQ